MGTDYVTVVRKLQPELDRCDYKVLEAFLTPPVDRMKFDCWFRAFMVLLETGNLVDALKELISCLTGTMGSEKILQCAVKAIFQFIMGVPLEEVVVGFINCLLNNGGGGGGGDDQIDPPNYKEVQRCGG